ncbi:MULTISPECIES: hypothetical protein [Bacillota]|uniref:hypothetical protein n=1 Tax=Bacillota TaxID=1239 RepID=UPI000E41823E|nr:MULTISPECIES: hypothetical protein [Bacillota]RGB58574.1 hypothetical protein DW271_02490 [Absiella sp. AM22-9]
MELVRTGEVTCPFCGKKLVIKVDMERDPYTRYIKCIYCKKSFYAVTKVEVMVEALPAGYVESNGKNIRNKDRMMWQSQNKNRRY